MDRMAEAKIGNCRVQLNLELKIGGAANCRNAKDARMVAAFMDLLVGEQKCRRFPAGYSTPTQGPGE